jgi:hypothetical protein
MMKRLYYFLFPVLLLAGCGGFQVTVKDDPFKKATVITSDIWHKVIDSNIDNRRVLYQKEINKGKMSNPTVCFEFLASINNSSYSGEELGHEVYILCDSNSFKLDLVAGNKVQQSQVGSSTTTDSAGNNVTQVHSANFCHLTGKIILTPDIQKAILNCRNYQIRFYVGNNTFTLQATEKQLEAVKKFLAVEATNMP